MLAITNGNEAKPSKLNLADSTKSAPPAKHKKGEPRKALLTYRALLLFILRIYPDIRHRSAGRSKYLRVVVFA